MAAISERTLHQVMKANQSRRRVNGGQEVVVPADLQAHIAATTWTEADLQAHIVKRCDELKLLVFHDNDARLNRAGFPDLCIVGRRVLHVELKSNTGTRTEEQMVWAMGVNAAENGEYRLWRPSDYDAIERELRSLAA